MDGHSRTEYADADHGGHVAAAADDYLFETGIDGIEDITRLAWLFELQHNITDAEERARKHLLDIQSRDRQVFPSSARSELKSFGYQLLEVFVVPDAEGTIGADVFGMVAAIPL